MKTSGTALIVAATWFAVPVAAQDDVPACTAAVAEPASIVAIAADPARFTGHCVSVDGIREGGLLYADNAALYAGERQHGHPASSGVIIGIDGSDRVAPAQAVRVIGRVDDCAARESRLRAGAAPDEFIMLGGYCHSFHGPVLAVAAETPLDSPGPTRLTRDGVGAEAGDLAPLAAGADQRLFQQVGDHVFTLVRAGDRAGLMRILRPTAGGGQRGDAEAGALADALLAPDSPLVAMRGAAPRIIVLGWREPLWADAGWRAEQAASGAREGIACLSTHAGIDTLWPIAVRDAHFLPGRPYACMWIGVGASGMVALEFDRDARALPEPPEAP